MATIKLGNKTLGKIAIGSSTIGDSRKLDKQQILKSVSLDNHPDDKEVVNLIRAYELVRDNIPGAGSGVSGTWLLSNDTWNDNGVWDDTQTWSE